MIIKKKSRVLIITFLDLRLKFNNFIIFVLHELRRQNMPRFKYESKDVYYKIYGNGKPLLLLHGNTASSKMFKSLLKNYTKKYKVILIDFPGHGKSSRLKEFKTDFWFYNSQVCYSLIKKLNIEKTAVIGTSGGALVGINLALEHPECVSHLIADSFEGEYPLKSYIDTVELDREQSKRKFIVKLFWFINHGFGWKKIVDLDTKMLLKFNSTGKAFFHKPISELVVPSLLIGSRQDEFCDHLDKIYTGLQNKNPNLKIHLFETGGHPAMLSNSKDFFNLVTRFIKE